MRAILLTSALLVAWWQFGCLPVGACEGGNCPTDGGGLGGAGGVDAGEEADAGADRADAGPPRRDAGTCPPSPHASAGELATTPRANQAAELLIIESTGRFVANDESYARVARDLPRLLVIDAGAFPPRFLPDFLPTLSMTFADAGIADVLSQVYSAWDCLNQTYDGDVTRTSPFGYATVEFRKVIDVRVLVAEYEALPQVTFAYPDRVGVPATCGYANDFCLDVDAGVFTYLGWVDTSQCSRTWFRLTTHLDGGVLLDIRDAGLPADDWMDALPSCASRLWGHPHRWPDGGFK